MWMENFLLPRVHVCGIYVPYVHDLESTRMVLPAQLSIIMVNIVVILV